MGLWKDKKDKGDKDDAMRNMIISVLKALKQLVLKVSGWHNGFVFGSSRVGVSYLLTVIVLFVSTWMQILWQATAAFTHAFQFIMHEASSHSGLSNL
jgi:hypothetical protein